MSTQPPEDYNIPHDGPVLIVTKNSNEVTVGTIVSCTVQVITAVFVLLLYGLVLDTMVRLGKSNEAADLMVAGLALTDAVIGVFVVWATIYTLFYFQNVYECLARLGLVHSAALIGKMHLLLLTMDRFLKIVFPYRMIVGLNLAMTVLMTLLYVKLILVARRQVAAIAALTRAGETMSRARKDPYHHAWRYTKTILLIVGTNSASWMPMAIVVIMSVSGAFGDMNTARKGDFILYTSTLVYCNSLLNPLIYAVKIPAIRSRYRALFCRCLGRNSAVGILPDPATSTGHRVPSTLTTVT